ncbi:MAG: YfcE family phosphodiesterase, partial [Clostridia bacterium]|nr:YfcE family phosphodiesterase [Clostridia bacterium]
RMKYPEKTFVINGNCDPVNLGENESVISVEGVKIFACHGHRYCVKSNLYKLAEKAKSLGCGIALYGHTHKAMETQIDGVTLLNPGAGKKYSENSYLYIVVNGEKAVFKTVTVQV